MDYESLLRRVERVERENKFLKLVGLLVLVVLVGLGAVQKDNKGRLPVSDNLVTHKLLITDEQGNSRAIITADKDGTYLHFQTSPSAALKLGLVGEEPHLDTIDKAAKNGWRNWLGKGGVIPVPIR